MIQEERHNKIEDFLRIQKMASLKQIAEVAGVSVDTVRRDLTLLEKKGIVSKVRGGAMYNDDSRVEPFSMRIINRRELKRELVECIHSVLSDMQTVSLNNGTTNVEVARYLVENYSQLIVITNSMAVMEIISKAEKFKVIMLGGNVDLEESCTFGPVCEKQLSEYNIDVSFIAANAVSYDKGITDFRMHEIGVIQSMCAASRKNYAVMDSGKFDKSTYLNALKFTDIDAIITDSHLPHEMEERYGKVVKLIHPRNC